MVVSDLIRDKTAESNKRVGAIRQQNINCDKKQAVRRKHQLILVS